MVVRDGEPFRWRDDTYMDFEPELIAIARYACANRRMDDNGDGDEEEAHGCTHCTAVMLKRDYASALHVHRLCEGARLPARASEGAAGYDLCAARDVIIPARGGRGLVPTGLAISVPHGTYGRIAPRSGLALKKGINVGAGVVDFDYRGPVGVVLFNHGEEDLHVQAGDRVAQLILERVVIPLVVECTLNATERGASGFGSTGTK